MKKSILVLVVLVLAIPATLAAEPNTGECKRTTTYTETFTGESNDGNWWHHFNIETTAKGKHGEFIYSGPMTTFYPRAETQMKADSVFHGNYTERGVVEISIDLAAFEIPQTDQTFMSPTLQLINDSGTPRDISDDCIVYLQSGLDQPARSNIEKPDFVTYTFAIPSASQTLPQPNNADDCTGTYCEMCPDTNEECWGVATGRLCPTLGDWDATFRNVLADVDQVHVSWMGPDWFALILPWQSAIDNPSITECK